jgi:hypothetical protein
MLHEQLENRLLRFLQRNCVAQGGIGKDKRFRHLPQHLENTPLDGMKRDKGKRQQANFKTAALNHSATLPVSRAVCLKPRLFSRS